jgi:hypothetical protein
MRLLYILAAAVVVVNSACTPARAPSPVLSGVRVSAGGDQQPADRVLIRTGTAEVEVDSILLGYERATAIATALGGRVDREQLTERSATLVLRIPDAQLEAALDSLATLGEMTSRSLSARDVTMEVIDVDARLANLRAARDRLRELHARATAVSDVVAVERELARIQGEIDSLEARRTYLRDAAALSQLQVTLNRRVILGPLGVVAKGLGWVLEKLFVLRR